MKKGRYGILILIILGVLVLPAPAAVNGNIAFSSFADGFGNIMVMHADGSGAASLRYGLHPEWSPDGTKIAYANTSTNDVYVMNAVGTGPVRLTTSTGWDDYPAWSPDGTKIAFSSYRDGYFNIYVMNADGSGQTSLGTTGSDSHPAWSPDGTKIAFERTLAYQTAVYVMNADGSGQAALTGTGCARPAWSPNGTKILFSKQLGTSDSKIWVMNTDGSGQAPLPLINGMWIDDSPAWSPDGTKITFESNRDGNFEIYVMNNDGTGLVRLTNNGYDDYSPAWGTGSVVLTPPTEIAVFRNSTWFIDSSNNFAWDGVPPDTVYTFGVTGGTPVSGDWNGDGKTEAGVYDGSSIWYLDYNGNGVYDGPVIDRTADTAGLGVFNYNPVVGDWDGSGKDKIGAEKDGFWLIDYNGNYIWDGTVIDRFAAFGLTGDHPVVGDWDGSGKDKIGAEKDGFWAIDYNGNYTWDGTVTDRFAGFGLTGDNPVVGDWDGNGKDKIGAELNGFWGIDYNGNYVWDGVVTDRFAGFGLTGDTPVVGDWDGNGKTEIGAYWNGFWGIDYNGNYLWDGVVLDRFAGFGQTGDSPVVGNWS